MKISVITWDANFRENTHIIDFFVNQDFPECDFEVIWVDFYDSNDLAREKIAIYPNVRILTMQHAANIPWHLGKCVNAGVKSSSGELLIIPDGDIAVEQNFLTYVWQTHQEYRDLVLYFRRYDEPQQASCHLSCTSISYLKQQVKLNNPTNFAGCLSLGRRSFERIRGYETHDAFAGPGVNGRETYVRLRNAGMSIKWSPDKNVYHPWHSNTGLAAHEDRRALWFAVSKYPWIIPYAGLKQSWIVRCRELSGDIAAEEAACDQYLVDMPEVDIKYYRKLSRQPSRSFLSGVPRKISGLLKGAAR